MLMGQNVNWNDSALALYGEDVPRLKERLETDVGNLLGPGLIWAKRRKVVTGYCDLELYDWDAYFENLFLSYFGVNKYCRTTVEAVLDDLEESGFVSRSFMHKRPRQHFKPFLAQLALLGSRQDGNFAWLNGQYDNRTYYERLQMYLYYWTWHSDADKNNLSYWDGSDHSGMDNQVLRLGHIGHMEYEGPDLNCYLVREFRAMKELALALGKPEDASRFEAKADVIAKAMNELLWDETDGIYYDRSEKTGQLNRRKTVSGILPMFAGVPDKAQAERLVREHLMNPEEFWLEYPVATWAKNEEGYQQGRTNFSGCNWMGTTWLPTNYMVFHGLLQYGYREEAKLLAEKTFRLVINEMDTREYYDGETGTGLGRWPFWGWSTLGYVMKFELDNSYTPSDLSRTQFMTLGRIL